MLSYHLSYLSKKDHKRLEELRELSSKAIPPEELQRAAEEIAQIEAKRKLMEDCSIEECHNLKAQLYDKYTKLIRIGRQMQSRQFVFMLQAVDARLAYLYKNAPLEDNPFMPMDPKKIDEKMVRDRKDAASTSNSENGTVSSRWSIVISDDD